MQFYILDLSEIMVRVSLPAATRPHNRTQATWSALWLDMRQLGVAVTSYRSAARNSSMTVRILIALWALLTRPEAFRPRSSATVNAFLALLIPCRS